MNLFEEDEELLRPKKKKTKIKQTTIILVAITILTILFVAVIIAIVYLRSTILSIKIDGKNAADLESIIIIEENNKVYMPIRRMGEYLKYDTYNGDYVTRSEDPTKCYVENIEEVVSFVLNSNVITKVMNGQSQQIKITEPIKEINGELCITAQGAQDAFNFKFNYDLEDNQINIQTLNYLYTFYSNYFAQNAGYILNPNETFANKTAILDDMLIIQAANKGYGVISTSGKIILETKYDNIEYLRSTSDFLVESSKKKGIISKNQKQKVELIYDSIEKVTNKNDIFYIVGKSNLYGMLDSNGQNIIYPEFEKIGIDVTIYNENGVTNGYILYNELVPLRKNNKWALYNIQGNKVTDFIYDGFGSTSRQGANTFPVLEVQEYKLIVANKGGKYDLITTQGEGLFKNFILDSVYIAVSSGKKSFYITSGDRTIELIPFLQQNGVSKPNAIQ